MAIASFPSEETAFWLRWNPIFKFYAANFAVRGWPTQDAAFGLKFWNSGHF
jgi:hypothetical protein